MIENPFPGMNPYLESRWGDVHARLVAYAADMLQEALPEDLRARMQERVFVEGAGIEERSFSPDVHVDEGRQGSSTAPSDTGAAVVVEPLMIHLPQGEVTEAYLEIIDARSGGRVVTIIEFVSRANKAFGPGRELYLQKQEEARGAGTNIMEIDLLRGGQPVTLADRHVAPVRRTTYHASVWRAARPLVVVYYPIALRVSLSPIKLPLRPTGKDVTLDLQALVNQCYGRGRYDDIDYSKPPHPPLSAQDAEWATNLLPRTYARSTAALVRSPRW